MWRRNRGRRGEGIGGGREEKEEDKEIEERQKKNMQSSI